MCCLTLFEVLQDLEKIMGKTVFFSCPWYPDGSLYLISLAYIRSSFWLRDPCPFQESGGHVLNQFIFTALWTTGNPKCPLFCNEGDRKKSPVTSWLALLLYCGNSSSSLEVCCSLGLVGCELIKYWIKVVQQKHAMICLDNWWKLYHIMVTQRALLSHTPLPSSPLAALIVLKEAFPATKKLRWDIAPI